MLCQCCAAMVAPAFPVGHLQDSQARHHTLRGMGIDPDRDIPMGGLLPPSTAARDALSVLLLPRAGGTAAMSTAPKQHVSDCRHYWGSLVGGEDDGRLASPIVRGMSLAMNLRTMSTRDVENGGEPSLEQPQDLSHMGFRAPMAAASSESASSSPPGIGVGR